MTPEEFIRRRPSTKSCDMILRLEHGRLMTFEPRVSGALRETGHRHA